MITGPRMDGNNYSSALANDCWGTTTTPLVMSIMVIDMDGGGSLLYFSRKFVSTIRLDSKHQICIEWAEIIIKLIFNMQTIVNHPRHINVDANI